MTDQAPSATTNFGMPDQAIIDWNAVRDQLTAPAPPDAPGGHFPSYLGTVRPDGRPHTTRVGVRWYDGDLYFLSGPGTRKARNLAASPVCTFAIRLDELDLDLILEGEAQPATDPVVLDAAGALIRQSGWPVERTDGGFTAPFGPLQGDAPPWTLYRFVFHTAIAQGRPGGTSWRFER
ncbi:MAG TPA: pyridoxamine 5'-phosphate oxidase family protein [Thermomicrobiales bacterium]|nr:pyridoxamine 5'-phosphate oxidase family protein [Thermomicrobiales bacterium]